MENIRELIVNLESSSKTKPSALPRDDEYKRFFQLMSYRKQIKKKTR
jgi:hypothetical protein